MAAVLVLAVGIGAGGAYPDFKVAVKPRAAAPAPHLRGQVAVQKTKAIDKVLAYTPYVAQGSRRKKKIALTFDDGPGPLSGAFARLLKHEHVPATFFVVGLQFNAFEPAVRLERRLGFAIGNHTEGHVFLSGHPGLEQRRQIRDTAAKMRAVRVPNLRLFRPPGRSFDRTTFRVLKRMRALMVLWSVDSRDYTRPGTRAIIRNVLSAAQPGAIVLMHDAGGDRSQTLAALPSIIRRLRRRGYEFVTVPELLASDPPPRHQPIPAAGSGDAG